MEYRSQMMKKSSRTGFLCIAVGVLAILLAGCGPVSSVADRVKSLGGGGDGSVGAVPADAAAGEIVFMEGTVSVNGRPLSIGDVVQHGETIVVADDGYAEIGFGDHRILRALAGSRLALDGRGRRFVLEQGALGVIQSKARVFSRNTDWTLETPTVVAAVRGTLYFARVENPDEVYFCLCNGKIHLEDSDDGGVLDLEAAHHQAVRFIRADSGIVYESAPMLYHSDEDMESLADLVNVPVDWNRIGD